MLNNTTINPTIKTFLTMRASLWVSLYVLIIKMPMINKAPVKMVPNNSFIIHRFLRFEVVLLSIFIISHCYKCEIAGFIHNYSKIFINLGGIFCIFFWVVSTYTML